SVHWNFSRGAPPGPVIFKRSLNDRCDCHIGTPAQPARTARNPARSPDRDARPASRARGRQPPHCAQVGRRAKNPPANPRRPPPAVLALEHSAQIFGPARTAEAVSGLAATATQPCQNGAAPPP